MLPSSTKTTYSSNHAVVNPSTLSLGMQLNLKQLKLWFSMWHGWQKRIVICRIIENCPKTNLELLATSLEPILHLDFSTTLSPLMAALHHEGSRTFRIQRATDFTVRATPIQSTLVTKSEPWMKNDSNTELPQISESISHLETIPNSEPINPLLGIYSKPDPLFLPVIKDTHSKHKVSPASSDLARSTDIIDRSSTIESSPLHRSYNSVPNIRSSVDLLNMTKKYNTNKRARRRSMDRRSLTTSVTDKRLLKHKKLHQLELYKTQLSYISQWMNECKVGDITILLLDIVKMSDKALLGYLVQCLYHRLQVKREIDSLSDNLLLKVFSYLDPVSLLRSRMVCLQWYYLAGSNALWRRQCAILGTRESIGDDLVGAIEAVHRITSLEGNEVKVLDIDWLQAYRDLTRLIDKMKSLVKKLAEAKEREEETNSRPLTSTQLRSSFTLRELLDTVRDGSRMSDLSTQEVYLTAPESAATRRRRLRTERTLHESPPEENAIDSDNPLKEHTDSGKTNHRKPKPAIRKISLLDCGIDKRPIIPSLPNPDGIECLILAGFLTPNETPKPGRVAPIPTLGRLKLSDATVLCLGCDERKVIAGCSDRLIRVYDIRSGRLVSVLKGHKGSVQCLQFDDHNLVSGSWDTTCIIWDVVHYSIVKVLVGHTDCVSCLQFHNSALVTGSYDHSVKLWDVATWECLITIYPAHKKPITCLAFNGLNIYTGSEDKTVKMWDPIDGSKKALLKHDARLTSMVLSKLLLITACSDGEMYLWDLRHMTVIMQWQTAYDNAFASVSSITLERGKIYAAASDSMVYEWDIATGTCVRSMQGHSAGLTGIWAGYNRIVTSSEDQTISVWKTKKAIDQGNDESSQYSTLPVRVINIY